MSGKNVNFGDKKIKKSDFYKNEKVAKIEDIDVNKILMSKEEPYGTKSSIKYLIGYNNNDVIRPLCIKLPQMTGYVRKSEGNTTMSFKISDKQLLKKYNQIWKKVKSLLNIKFDSEPVYGDNDKYIKAKVKTYDGSVITNFQGKNAKRKSTMQVFINNNARFCYQSKEKVLSSNPFGRMQILTEKDQNGEPY